MHEKPVEYLKALDAALDSHDRATYVGTLFVKIMVAAGYSDSDIRLAASTMVSYVD